MAEKRENSVLFSLRELRQIEDDRVKTEEETAKARAEAERQAKVDADRRAREAAERARREVEDAERARIDAEQNRIREEQLRVEEAERRARVEAQSKLEEQRLRMEMEAKAIEASKKKPVGLIIAASSLFLVVAGLVVFLVLQSQKTAKEQAEAAERERVLLAESEKLEKEIANILVNINTIDDENKTLLAGLDKAQTDADRQKIKDRIAANSAKSDYERKRVQQLQDAKRAKKASVKCTDPNDPLCGL
jgi:colicin import membrane protein